MLKNRDFKLARMKKGYTQLRLANEIGVKERLITLIETGRAQPDVGLALRIGESLGVDAKEIFPDVFNGF
ncbi:MAG: helix-turn-helix domain-containing protein [Deltaproteobacteria bacterium]|nr:helix-turn-helix domain-containing protein [Deltaproteobacteria bacterium]